MKWKQVIGLLAMSLIFQGCSLQFAKKITKHSTEVVLTTETTTYQSLIPRVTYISTACVLIEIAGIQIITDPVFDKAGSRFTFAPWYIPDSTAMTEKLTASLPAYPSIKTIDIALISHDHHIDNLDISGRKFLATQQVRKVVTTMSSQKRLSNKMKLSKGGEPVVGGGLGIGEKLVGLSPWKWVRFKKRDVFVEILATPGLHGTINVPQAKEVIGFLLKVSRGGVTKTIYISGDTVFIEEMNHFAQMFRSFGVKQLDYAFVHLGGAQLPKLPFFSKTKYSFTGKESLKLLRLIQPRYVIPIHFEDWSHFKETKTDLQKSLKSSVLTKNRTLFLPKGKPFLFPE